MKNIFKKASLLFIFAVLLSACSLPGSKNEDLSGGPKSDNQVTQEITASPTPTVSKDTDVDSIEADLKSTLILEEDFSDL